MCICMQMCTCQYTHILCMFYIHVFSIHVSICIWKRVVYTCHTHTFTNSPEERLSFHSDLWILCGVCCPFVHVRTDVPLTSVVPAICSQPPTPVAKALDYAALSPVMGLCTSAMPSRSPRPYTGHSRNFGGPTGPQAPQVTSSQAIYPSPGLLWTEWEASEMQESTRKKSTLKCLLKMTLVYTDWSLQFPWSLLPLRPPRMVSYRETVLGSHTQSSPC